MKVAAVAAALLSAAGVLAQSGQLTINTPLSPVVCEPLLITWSGGTPPYFLTLLPGGQPTAAPILDFGQQTGNSLTWVVNQTAGTSLGLNLRDNTGALAQSAPFTIQSGPSTSCLTGGSSSAASGGSSSSGSTPAGSSTTSASTPGSTPANTSTPPATTNTAPSNTNTAATSKTSSPSGSAPSTSPTNSGAISAQAASGLVTALGAAFVALVMA